MQVYVPKTVYDGFVVESYVSIEGEVVAPPGKSFSFKPFEISAKKVQLLAPSDADFAGRCPEGSTQDTQLTERHLHLRTSSFAITTKLRALLLKAFRDHFDGTGSTEITPPSFVGALCESGAHLFQLKHPGHAGHDDMDCWLTQSSQFYLEYALPGLGDTHCIAPSFRAEKSHTRRHLTEFLHVEAEYRSVLTMEDHYEKLRFLLKDVVERFYTLGRPWLAELGLTEHVEGILKLCDEIVIISHREAIDYCRQHHIYKEESTQTHFDYTDDIPEMQERKMIDAIGKIVFLTHFPTETKSFYMLPDKDQPQVCFGVDVEVVGVGEIVGSGVRVFDGQQLLSQLKYQHLDEKDYREYFDLRKYGAGRTSGCGVGFDRMFSWLMHQPSIRDVVTFPRYPGRVTP